MINHITMVSLVPRLFTAREGNETIQCHEALGPNSFPPLWSNHVHDRTQSDNVRYYVTVVARSMHQQLQTRDVGEDCTVCCIGCVPLALECVHTRLAPPE